MSTITENVHTVQARLAAAARRAGRDPASVRLLAATKMNDPERIQEAIRAGVTLCGENRVQEFLSKSAVNAYEGSAVHFIGHLQKNKVRFLVGAVSLIHSVDSLELMERIHKRARSLHIVQDVLLEVNLAGEASKSGVSPEELPSLLRAAGSFPGLRVRGLMAIPPMEEETGRNRQYFAALRQLSVDIREKKYDNVSMTELSMGMSRDFEEAVEEGATLVRLGTAIFGPRYYGKQEEPRDGSVG